MATKVVLDILFGHWRTTWHHRRRQPSACQCPQNKKKEKSKQKNRNPLRAHACRVEPLCLNHIPTARRRAQMGRNHASRTRGILIRIQVQRVSYFWASTRSDQNGFKSSPQGKNRVGSGGCGGRPAAYRCGEDSQDKVGYWKPQPWLSRTVLGISKGNKSNPSVEIG